MSVSATIDDVWSEFVATRRPDLREALMVNYVPLVRYVVGRLNIPSTTMWEQDDLISYGIAGLINAIDRFEPERGIRFEAFAIPRIRGAVIDQLRALNWLPRSVVARVRQMEKALAALEQELGRPATEEEITADLQISTGRYRQTLQEADSLILSLDAPLSPLPSEDGIATLSDLLEDVERPGPAEQVEQEELVKLLNQAIDQLPPRERLLLALYYQEELTMKEISKVLEVSESRVCQLHMQAVLRLRSMLNAQQEALQPKKRQRARVAAAGNTRARQEIGSVPAI